jgi:hypothetical protein
MGKNGPLALLFNALVVSFMLAPLLVVCVVAFTPENTLTIPTTHLSLRWFKAVFAHPDFVQSFKNSLWLALIAATVSTAIAVPAGIAISRYSFPGRDFLNGLFLSPLIIPHLVLGVALLRTFSLIGATGSFFWLALAHVVVITPYVLRLVVAAVEGTDRSAEQAALSLGAGHRVPPRHPADDPARRHRRLAAGLHQQLRRGHHVDLRHFAGDGDLAGAHVHVRHRVDRSAIGRRVGPDGRDHRRRDAGAGPGLRPRQDPGGAPMNPIAGSTACRS